MPKHRARALVAAIAAIAAIVSIPMALAAGATPAPPTVATAPATNVSGSGATLNGSVNPNGQQTNYAFQWGPTAGYGHETPLTSAGSGSSSGSVSAALSGLASGSTYHYRIIAINDSGTSVGSDQSFTIGGNPPAPSTPPTASTGSATNVGQSGATVNGTVNPGGQATSYYFEYGPTANYGFETAATSGGSGVTDEPVSANLAELASSTTYHYRLVAVSPGGTALGSDQTFTTTTPPAVTTGPASQVRKTSAVPKRDSRSQGPGDQLLLPVRHQHRLRPAEQPHKRRIGHREGRGPLNDHWADDQHELSLPARGAERGRHLLRRRPDGHRGPARIRGQVHGQDGICLPRANHRRRGRLLRRRRPLRRARDDAPQRDRDRTAQLRHRAQQRRIPEHRDLPPGRKDAPVIQPGLPPAPRSPSR